MRCVHVLGTVLIFESSCPSLLAETAPFTAAEKSIVLSPKRNRVELIERTDERW
jgi:hypothetical protein